MKKTKIFLPIVTLALTLGLVACGGSQASGGNSSGGGAQSSSIPAKPKITVAAAGDKKSLQKGETVQLSAKEGDNALDGITWSSSAATVASVSDAGLVTALAFGEATITAKKDGYQDGKITINVVRPAATATLHFEVADHYSADGEWINSNRGPGEQPIYEKSSASDGTCVAYFGDGDKETLTFTSSAAVKAELVVTMGHNDSANPLSDMMGAKFNNAELDLSKVSFVSDSDGSGNYSFIPVSFGEVNLIAGNNVLEISMKGNAPYIDDLLIYAESASTIEVVPAPQKEKIVITNPEADLTIDPEQTLQLTSATTGLSFVSSNEAVATVSPTGLVTGVAKGTATITASKEGMLSCKVTITVNDKLAAGEFRIEAESGKVGDADVSEETDIKVRTASTGEKLTERWAAGATLTITFSGKPAGSYKLYINARGAGQYGTTNIEDIAAVMEVKFNNSPITLPSATAISGRTFADYLLGTVSVTANENKIEIKALGENADQVPNIDFFKFMPNAN